MTLGANADGEPVDYRRAMDHDASDDAVVHVVIPAYGDDAYLREAIASVCGQESDAWLLTVVDDGPEAPQLERWVSELHDPRVAYERNERRLGLNRNFARCASLARAPRVVVMGADDRMLSNYVGVVAGVHARHPDATWIQPAVRVIDAEGQPSSSMADRLKRRISPVRDLHGVVELRGESLAASLLRGNWMYFPAVAFLREPLQAHGFREGLDVVLDLDLYFDLLLDGGSGAYSPEVAFEYRRHAASASSTDAVSGHRFDEERDLVRGIRGELDRRGWHRASRAAALRPMSRLHSLATLPSARDPHTVAALVRNALLP